MSLPAYIQSQLEDEADVVMDVIDDYSDKWGLETTIGLLTHMMQKLNNKRVMPEKEIVIKK